MSFWKRTVNLDGELIVAVRAQQNSLRGVNIDPTWENYVGTEMWHTICRDLTTNRERAKFRAWWVMLRNICRAERDPDTMKFAVGLLIQERLRRSYSKNTNVDPGAFGIRDKAHIQKVREYCLTNFEALCPEE